MKTSDKGLVALMIHEGIVPAPYADSVGVLTYGIGHTAAAGSPDPKTLPMGMPADLDGALREVMAVFKRDIETYEAAVNRAVKVQLEQHEFDALVSFHYNTGAIAKASLTKALNGGLDRVSVAALFMNWTKPVEVTMRRKAERDLFINAHYPTGLINVWNVSDVGRVIWKPARTLNSAEALALLNAGADPVRELQSLLGVTVDGIWGPKSQAALTAFKNTAARVLLLEKEL